MSNNNKINSINNESDNTIIDPNTSDDAWTQLNINDVAKFRIGVDDSDSDKFKISYGSALGTNDYFTITASGEISMPKQPCFLAHRNADLSNVTGDDTVYKIQFDSTEFDQNNDFDDVDDFTAPVDGKYYFCANVLLDSLTASYTNAVIRIVSTSDTYESSIVDPGAIQSGGQLSMRIVVIVPMTASDTAYVEVSVGNSTKAIDITGNTAAGAEFNYFAGYLMC